MQGSFKQEPAEPSFLKQCLSFLKVTNCNGNSISVSHNYASSRLARSRLLIKNQKNKVSKSVSLYQIFNAFSRLCSIQSSTSDIKNGDWSLLYLSNTLSMRSLCSLQPFSNPRRCAECRCKCSKPSILCGAQVNAVCDLCVIFLLFARILISHSFL